MTDKTILVLGSGPIRIGQAAEFDYSGSQACRALKEEGVKVILLNSNPATIQTDQSMADLVYIQPLTADVIKDILDEHHPYGVVATLGGQTALNLCVQCEETGMWAAYGTRILGTPVASILKAEGRDAFRQTMISIGQPVVPSRYVSTVEEALDFCSNDKYPFIIRPDFTLGGTGGGVARDIEELKERVSVGLRASPVNRVLVERYLEGWREIEAEVVRDSTGNSLCVCSMENIDPMGIHTGDSIVVSPVLTLNDRQWQKLRKASLDIVDAIGVEGACNVQLALHPEGNEYAVIEVNPRASRSSALASKATGYPIARMAAKITLGKTLTEMPNPVTGIGSSLSEPALDYVVVKLPRWPFDSFPQADTTLGTKMKATGEVLALGLTFNQALLKAFRSLDGPDRLRDQIISEMGEDCLWKEVLLPTDRRIQSILQLLRRGITSSEISKKTWIHPYFIEQLKQISDMERKLSDAPLSEKNLIQAKKMGLSDESIAFFSGIDLENVQKIKVDTGLKKAYREVDGCAGEIPSGSGYYYGTYGPGGDPFPADERPAIAVIGSGAIRIAQGVEFDYCCVKAVEAVRKRNYRAVMINNNPETVSTDHDISDALYVEPIHEEDVMDVLERERISGVFTSFGGQTSLKMGQQLDKRGIRILGNTCDSVDATEDRGRFASILDKLAILHPKGDTASTEAEALDIAKDIGFPLMVRPNFVIGGIAMQVVNRSEEFLDVVRAAFAAEPDQKILIDRFLPGKEFEIDALCDGGDVLIPGIFEHLDPAGVHSGDSIAIFPDISLTDAQRNDICESVMKLSSHLDLKGLMNVQFVLNQGTVYVIEANPRASRTIPIVSKLTQIPMVDIAVGIALGEKLRDTFPQRGLYEYTGPFGVKTPVFSTEKLPGLDHRLGPQMQSTGEALGVHGTVSQALWEALRGSEWKIPEKGRILLSVRNERKGDTPAIAALFASHGWKVDATPGTANLLAKWGLKPGTARKGEKLLDDIRNRKWDLIINLPGLHPGNIKDGYAIRRTAIEEGIPCLHSLEAASAVAIALSSDRL